MGAGPFTLTKFSSVCRRSMPRDRVKCCNKNSLMLANFRKALTSLVEMG